MFTQEELRARLLKTRLLSLIIKPEPSLEVIRFAADDFQTTASEESITICRGIKSHFENALHFWVVSQRQHGDWERSEEYFLPYLSGAVCRSLDERGFALMLDQTTPNLKRPVVLVPKGRYIWGQQMANEWNDSSALAEFEHEFISFNWETTA